MWLLLLSRAVFPVGILTDGNKIDRILGGFIKSHILSLVVSKDSHGDRPEFNTRPADTSGRHHQVETSRIVQQCHCPFRLDEFGRVQVRPKNVSKIFFWPRTIGIFQLKTVHSNACLLWLHTTLSFSSSLARLFWGDFSFNGSNGSFDRSCKVMRVHVGTSSQRP